MINISKSDTERFWSRVLIPTDTTECWLWSGKPNKGYGYIRVGRPKSLVGVHRLSYFLEYGIFDSDRRVDHKCHNTVYVNPSHLQLVTHKGNIENRRSANSNSVSKVRGVHYHKENSCWYVRVQSGSKIYYGGSFESIELAERVARDLRLEHMSNSLMDGSEWGDRIRQSHVPDQASILEDLNPTLVEITTKGGNVPIRQKDLDRFKSHVRLLPDGCEEFQSRPSQKYPKMNLGSILVPARRIALALSGHDLTLGAYVRFNCKNSRCVNPDHCKTKIKKVV